MQALKSFACASALLQTGCATRPVSKQGSEPLPTQHAVIIMSRTRTE